MDYSNLEAICRFCLTNRTKGFGVNSFQIDENMQKTFFEFTNSKLIITPSRPKLICLDCRNKFDYSVFFRNMIVESQIRLNQILPQETPEPCLITIKQEVSFIDESCIKLEPEDESEVAPFSPDPVSDEPQFIPEPQTKKPRNEMTPRKSSRSVINRKKKQSYRAKKEANRLRLREKRKSPSYRKKEEEQRKKRMSDPEIRKKVNEKKASLMQLRRKHQDYKEKERQYRKEAMQDPARRQHKNMRDLENKKRKREEKGMSRDFCAQHMPEDGCYFSNLATDNSGDQTPNSSNLLVEVTSKRNRNNKEQTADSDASEADYDHPFFWSSAIKIKELREPEDKPCYQ